MMLLLSGTMKRQKVNDTLVKETKKERKSKEPIIYKGTLDGKK